MKTRVDAALCALALVLATTPAMAYTGPGAGISAIGSLVALVCALALGIVGFVWYPAKRLLRRAKRKQAGRSEPGTPA